MQRKPQIRKPRATNGKTTNTAATPTIQTISAPSSTPDVSERIRERAYQLYEERGRQDGYDVDDWFRAEAELMRSA